MKSSSVTFLSLGPGDPELLTLQAVKALRSADVVLLPATRTTAGVQSSRAAEIVGELCPRERQRFYPLPMSADRQAVMAVYDEMYSDILHFLDAPWSCTSDHERFRKSIHISFQGGA